MFVENNPYLDERHAARNEQETLDSCRDCGQRFGDGIRRVFLARVQPARARGL